MVLTISIITGSWLHWCLLSHILAATHTSVIIKDILSGIYEKSVGRWLSLVPRLEAFALPNPVERATQKPTPIWYTKPTAHPTLRQGIPWARCIHIHKASTVASLLTGSESCEVSSRQEQSVSKRFPINVIHVFGSCFSPYRQRGCCKGTK